MNKREQALIVSLIGIVSILLDYTIQNDSPMKKLLEKRLSGIKKEFEGLI